MGSVQDYIDCPRCGQPNCVSDYYYKSNEEYIQCLDCGYYKSVEIKEDSRKKNFSDMTDDDWEITEIKEAYGSFRGRCKEDKVHFGGTISTKKHYDLVLKNLEEDIYDELTVSRYVNGKIIVTDMMRLMKIKKLIKNMKL